MLKLSGIITLLATLGVIAITVLDDIIGPFSDEIFAIPFIILGASLVFLFIAYRKHKKNEDTHGITQKDFHANKHMNLDAIKYLKDPKVISRISSFPTTEDERYATILGAPLIVTNAESPELIEMLNTDKAQEKVNRDSFAKMWGMVDRESALDALDGLLTPRPHYALNFRPDDITFCLSIGFTMEGINAIRDLRAWDDGRVAVVAKNALWFGFITRDEAVSYIKRAAESSSKTYRNWDEYILAYILGRGTLWGGDPLDQREIFEYLLNDETSVFNRTKWRSDFTA